MIKVFGPILVSLSENIDTYIAMWAEWISVTCFFLCVWVFFFAKQLLQWDIYFILNYHFPSYIQFLITLHWKIPWHGVCTLLTLAETSKVYFLACCPYYPSFHPQRLHLHSQTDPWLQAIIQNTFCLLSDHERHLVRRPWIWSKHPSSVCLL